MHCELAKIRAVQESQSGTVAAIVKEVETEAQQLVSNARLDFKVCLGDTAWEEDQVTIDQVTALRLGLKVGDKIRCVNLRPTSVPGKN